MKKIYLKLFLTILVISASVMHSQDLTKTGTTAAQFLKIGVGPRAIGMGGAFAATADDITSLYWNPAGLANNFSNEAFFNHVEWFLDVNFDYAAFSSHIPGLGTIAAFANVLSMEDMIVRTTDRPEGTGEFFSSGAMSLGLSYARFLTDNFSIGFNVKYVREHIWNESAAGFALDIGTMYKIPILNEFRLAASVSNFGTKMKLHGRDIIQVTQVGAGEGNTINTDIQLDEFDLPLLFRVGVATDIVKSDNSRLTLAVDAVHPNDNTEAINTGFEYAWNNLIYLRAGYKSLFERDTEQGMTAGIGVNYRVVGSLRIMMDYAYQEFGRLTNVHYLSMGIKF